jgi:Major intrinsic protein
VNKQIAEFVGTFALVFFGCGAAAIGGLAPAGPTAINLLGIASAFGFAIVAMAYGIGPISGCHVNPARRPRAEKSGGRVAYCGRREAARRNCRSAGGGGSVQ